MNRFLLTVLFFWHAVFADGQTTKGITDSVFQIREVTVSSNRLEYFSIGNKIRTVDSSLLGSYSTSNLAQVIGAYSQVQINSYGLGLSNPSIRGTGSSHTAVLWNGFNLQDLLNGGVDCSLLPINFFDDIKVQYGGCSALYGSGAIGGAIHLNNKVDFEKGFISSVTTGYGSYDNMFGGLNMGYGNASYAGFIKTFYNNAQNDFKFKNTAEFGSPIVRLKNAERKQYGVLAGNAFRLDTHSKLESFFWFQDNDKNIPSTMVAYSQSNERDKFYRTTASWKTWNENSDLTIRSYFSNYYMIYDNNHFQSIQSSSEAEYNIKLSPNHIFNSGLDYTYEKAIAKNLLSNVHRNRISLFNSYRFTSNESKLKIALNVRNEMINRALTPITFSAGFEKTITSSLVLKGVLSRNYRVPTFDDLYWQNGGNPNLKCELGLNQDLGLIFTKRLENINLRLETSGFNNKVSNWILWSPADNGLWYSENISKVWARGVENDLSVSFPIQQALIKTSFSYTYTKSTKINADYPSDPALNQQLIYVPLHKCLLSMTMLYKGYTFYFAQSYSSKRFTKTDNSKSVAPYTIGNMSISKKINLHNQALDVSFQINNLWNATYQVMEYYPMPLLNYQLNIHLIIK